MALRPISRIDDFSFPTETWDVRGWKVRTTDEEKVGRVDDILLDRGGELRYLDVDLGFLKKHVLVPMDHAHADRETETVWLEHVTKDRLEEAPEYALDPERLDESYERRLDAYYGGDAGSRRPTPPPERSHEGVEDGPLELRRMSDLSDDYKVAGEDPRGWKVLAGDGEKVGRVSELLVEPGDMQARFLDIVVDEEALGLEPVDRHLLLPVERVRLDRSSSKVVVGGLLPGDMRDYPQYGGLPVSRQEATRLDRFFDRAGGDSAAEPRPEGGVAEPPRSPARHFYSSRAGTGRVAREE